MTPTEPLEEDVRAGEEAEAKHVPEGVPDQRWRIESDRAALWVMDRLARVRQEATRLQAAAELEKGRIETWLEEQMRPLDRDDAFFEERLTEYHRRRTIDPLLEAAPEGEPMEETWARLKRKSYPLPNGKVRARLKPGRWEVADEEAAVAALGDDSEAVRVTKGIAKSKLAEVLLPTPDGQAATTDGVIVPGIVWKDAELALDAEPTGEERPAWLAPMPEDVPED